MTNLSLRLYALLLLVLNALGSWAQNGDLEPSSGRRGMEDTFASTMEDASDYQSLHISFMDIVMVVLVLVSCYVFGKIWKGCTYMILVVAVAFYMLTH